MKALVEGCLADSGVEGAMKSSLSRRSLLPRMLSGVVVLPTQSWPPLVGATIYIYIYIYICIYIYIYV